MRSPLISVASGLAALCKSILGWKGVCLFFKLFNRCMVPFKSGCIWLYCGDNIHCNGGKLPKTNFKMAFFVFQFKNPVHVRPLRCNKHLEQRKCNRYLSLWLFFRGKSQFLVIHIAHTKYWKFKKKLRVRNAVHADIVLIILQ